MSKTILATITAITSLTIASCGNDSDPFANASERCQEEVSSYAKYPTTAEWVDGPKASHSEDNENHIYVSGRATFNNDSGQPVNTIYQCVLDTSTDDWMRHPFLEPERDAIEKLSASRWSGATSPMRSRYGDNMMDEYTNASQ